MLGPMQLLPHVLPRRLLHNAVLAAGEPARRPTGACLAEIDQTHVACSAAVAAAPAPPKGRAPRTSPTWWSSWRPPLLVGTVPENLSKSYRTYIENLCIWGGYYV